MHEKAPPRSINPLARWRRGRAYRNESRPIRLRLLDVQEKLCALSEQTSFESYRRGMYMGDSVREGWQEGRSESMRRELGLMQQHQQHTRSVDQLKARLEAVRKKYYPDG